MNSLLAYESNYINSIKMAILLKLRDNDSFTNYLLKINFFQFLSKLFQISKWIDFESMWKKNICQSVTNLRGYKEIPKKN